MPRNFTEREETIKGKKLFYRMSYTSDSFQIAIVCIRITDYVLVTGEWFEEAVVGRNTDLSADSVNILYSKRTRAIRVTMRRVKFHRISTFGSEFRDFSSSVPWLSWSQYVQRQTYPEETVSYERHTSFWARAKRQLWSPNSLYAYVITAALSNSTQQIRSALKTIFVWFSPKKLHHYIMISIWLCVPFCVTSLDRYVY